jgi:uncharacterized protein (TIGR03083 family)
MGYRAQTYLICQFTKKEQTIMQAQMTTPTMSAQDATRIPALSHEEAMRLTAVELERFTSLAESLSQDDWDKPTACSLWTVKDIVAHQASHVSSFTSLGSFISQFSPKTLFPYFAKGMSPLDAWNQAEVDRRRDQSPEAHIAEIRKDTAKSLQGKNNIPAWLRAITLPLPGFDQPRSMGYLFDIIYTRDMWMHRLDICKATGLKMQLDSLHDARLVALIIYDLAMKSKSGLHGRSAILDLTGIAGGRYQIGQAEKAEVTIEIDTLSFCILTSGREKAANLMTNGLVQFHGDSAFGREVLNFCENRVLY